MSIRTIDYAESYFKYKTPISIREVPTHKALKCLKLELQANASSIEIDLGDRNHRYLSLILTEAECASINRTILFVAPKYPGPLVIPAIAIAIEAL